jgi:hypothetical protein
LPTWRVTGAADLPLDRERAWDPARARERLVSHLAEQPEQARRGFVLSDGEQLNLPFADVVDGHLVASLAGVRAARSRLPTLQDPQVREAAEALLEPYLREAGAADEERRAMLPYAASLPLERGVGGLIAPGDGGEIPEGILRQLADPTVLNDTPLYWLRSVASTGARDFYGTVMQTDSLRNYAADAEAGLPFCNCHQHEELPYGRVFGGKFFQARGQNLARTEMDAYVPLDMNVNGVDTSHLVRAIRTGVANDVSIQFNPERIVCSLDQREMPKSIWDVLFADPDDPKGPCRHVPGVSYEWEGKKQMALGLVHGAHCLELSPVYRGATPGAAVVSPSRALVVSGEREMAQWALLSPSLRTASLLAEADQLDRPTALLIEERVRGVRFPQVTTQRFAGWSQRADAPTSQQEAEQPVPNPTNDSAQAGEQPEPESGPSAGGSSSERQPHGSNPPAAEPQAGSADQELPPPVTRAADDQAATRPLDPALSGAVQPVWHAEVRAVLVGAGLAPDGFDGDPLAQLRESGRALQLERAWGAWGRRYRAELCVEVEREGVRAFGAEAWATAKPAYESQLQRGTVDELIALKTHFQGEAERRLRGGRLTRDDPERPAPNKTNKPAIPAAAFRS